MVIPRADQDKAKRRSEWGLLFTLARNKFAARRSQLTLSTIVAMPWPTPMHIVAKP
jgi:hypothetical protein